MTAFTQLAMTNATVKPSYPDIQVGQSPNNATVWNFRVNSPSKMFYEGLERSRKGDDLGQKSFGGRKRLVICYDFLNPTLNFVPIMRLADCSSI